MKYAKKPVIAAVITAVALVALSHTTITSSKAMSRERVSNIKKEFDAIMASSEKSGTLTKSQQVRAQNIISQAKESQTYRSLARGMQEQLDKKTIKQAATDLKEARETAEALQEQLTATGSMISEAEYREKLEELTASIEKKTGQLIDQVTQCKDNATRDADRIQQLESTLEKEQSEKSIGEQAEFSSCLLVIDEHKETIKNLETKNAELQAENNRYKAQPTANACKEKDAKLADLNQRLRESNKFAQEARQAREDIIQESKRMIEAAERKNISRIQELESENTALKKSRPDKESPGYIQELKAENELLKVRVAKAEKAAETARIKKARYDECIEKNEKLQKNYKMLKDANAKLKEKCAQ